MKKINPPSFRQQFDKITKAYYEDTLKPWDGCACFIGNLLDNNSDWEGCRTFRSGKLSPSNSSIYKRAINFIKIKSKGLYTPSEIVKLEHNFLVILVGKHNLESGNYNYHNIIPEEGLFKAMESTLEMLKEIHLSKDEIIEDYSFEKRKLNKQLVL